MSALFFYSTIWCFTLAFVVRTNKIENVHRKVILSRVRVTIVAVQKQDVLHILNIYVCVCVCVCVCVRARAALVVQHTKRMRCVVSLSVASSVPRQFSHFMS